MLEESAVDNLGIFKTSAEEFQGEIESNGGAIGFCLDVSYEK
jgi:hypothetical protein